MAKNTPQVAIITRTKNRPLLLNRAIKSVVQQTYGNYVLVIVNDGGDSKPIEKLLTRYKLEDKSKIITNKNWSGRGGACNIGIKNSESEYIVILDDDDTWERNFLETTVSYLDQNRKCFGVVTGSEVIHEEIKGNKIHFLKREPFLKEVKNINLFAMLGGNQFPNLAFMYRRAALKKVGDYYAGDAPLEDWDFNIRYLRYYDAHFIDQPLAHYHQRTGQTGEHGNSIFVPNFHDNQYNHLLNKYLREDLDKGVLGIGFISNLSQQISKGRANDLTFLNALIRQSTAETHDGINHVINLANSVLGLQHKVIDLVNSSIEHRIRRKLRGGKG